MNKQTKGRIDLVNTQNKVMGVGGEWEIKASVLEWIRHSMGNMANDMVIAMYEDRW